MILLVSSTRFLGGAERSLLELAEGLSASKTFKASLACPRDGELCKEAKKRQIDVTFVPETLAYGKKNVLRLPLMALGLFASAIVLYIQLRKHHVAVLHANGIKAAIPGAIAARLRGVPMVWHARDYPRRRLVTRFAMKWANAVVTPSRFLAATLEKICGQSSALIRVIPNAVGAPKGDAGEACIIREELSASEATRVITMIAQFVPWKRHDVFLDAAAVLSRNCDDVHFLVVGSDLWKLNQDYEKRLRERASGTDLKGLVTFLGEREDVGTIMAASDVLVLPSDNEPFGRVVVEAWRMGTPVVVSNNGGPAEIVEDKVTGYTFKQGDAPDLAKVIKEVISDTELTERTTKNAYEAAVRYGVEEHVEAVSNLYGELIR